MLALEPSIPAQPDDMFRYLAKNEIGPQSAMERFLQLTAEAEQGTQDTMYFDKAK